MIEKLLSNVREFGFSDGLLYNLSRLLELSKAGALHKYHFYAQPLCAKRRLPERRGKNIETRWLERGAPELADIPRPPMVIDERFIQGGRCLGAFIDDKLVGCLWYVLQRYQEDEVRCDFDFSNEKDCIWDFDVYVDPGHRLGMVFLRLWDQADLELNERGYRWSLSRISAFNQHSVRSHERLGAKEVGSALFLTLGNWQWSHSSQSKGVRWSRKDDDRPQLQIRLPANMRSSERNEVFESVQ